VISLRGLTALLDAKAVHPRRSALARTPRGDHRSVCDDLWITSQVHAGGQVTGYPQLVANRPMITR
jgi:hypothetical protein